MEELKVLIVPCGIEIIITENGTDALDVLIVPCGIEIRDSIYVHDLGDSLNRTMWN